MKKVLIGAVLGLVVGSGFATLLTLFIHMNRPNPTRRLAGFSETTAAIEDWLDPAPPVRQRGSLSGNLFLAIIFGGGAGAVVGAVTGATAAIVRALRESSISLQMGSPGPSERSPGQERAEGEPPANQREPGEGDVP